MNPYELDQIFRTYIDIQNQRKELENRAYDRKVLVCANGHMVTVEKIGVKSPFSKKRKRLASLELCPICMAKAEVREYRPPKIIKDIVAELKEQEKKLVAAMFEYVKDDPIWQFWLQYVKGIGPTHAAYLLSVIRTKDFEYPTKLWAYFGLYPIAVCEDCKAVQKPYRHGITCPKCGKPMKPKLPTKVVSKMYNLGTLGFDPTRRARMYVITMSLVMAGGVYGRVFSRWLIEDKANNKRTAWVRLAKLFLAHLYEVDRRIRGLPVPKPYMIEYGLHNEYIPPLIDEKPELITKTQFYEKLLSNMHYDVEKYIGLIRELSEKKA
ncbi:MAG: hypothetical protein DRJ47_06695 [Thermoprotei archaeon]|nr:MAG: hypothetical protein DRJ47_06695 [Thermoprotei archaeon]